MNFIRICFCSTNYRSQLKLFVRWRDLFVGLFHFQFYDVINSDWICYNELKRRAQYWENRHQKFKFPKSNCIESNKTNNEWLRIVWIWQIVNRQDQKKLSSSQSIFRDRCHVNTAITYNNNNNNNNQLILRGCKTRL